ncbi:MAG: hypothetical protein U5R06_06560 [candidate division KSB1 bacterium]|nr:hypothetical protein [candidate division KSB1 bacterium]
MARILTPSLEGRKQILLSERVTLKQTTFIDSTVQSDSVYYYAARTLDTDKEPDTSILSRTAAARPGKPPALQTIQPVNLTHIRLLFSKPMNERAKNVIHYNCNAPPKITSAVLDRSGRAVILTFDAELTADQTFSLFCSNLQDVYGIPLDSVRNSAEFTMASPAVTPYLKKGEWTDWNQAVLEFSTSMMKSSLVNSNNYMCDAGDITIAELTSQSKVALTVAFDEPPVKGQSIVFRTDNIENNLGINSQSRKGRSA